MTETCFEIVSAERRDGLEVTASMVCGESEVVFLNEDGELLWDGDGYLFASDRMI